MDNIFDYKDDGTYVPRMDAVLDAEEYALNEVRGAVQR